MNGADAGGDEVAPALPIQPLHDQKDDASSEPHPLGTPVAIAGTRYKRERAVLRARLLDDCRAAFADAEVLQTMDLIKRLQCDPEGRRWADLTPIHLASLLRKYGIGSTEIRFPEPVGWARGYRRDAFLEAWQRHTPQQDGAIASHQDSPPTADVENHNVSRRAGQASTQAGLPASSVPSKLTFQLSPKALKALEELCRTTGDTKTDCLNHGVQIYAWIQNRLYVGDHLCVIDKEGRATEIQIF